MLKNQSQKILIVEDEPNIRKPIVDDLTDLGYNVFIASNGNDAIKVFQKEKPDMVLLDLILPEKNGFDVLEHIRYKIKSDIPIIVISNLEGQQDLETAKNLGATEFIKKSDTSLRAVTRKVNEILQSKNV